MATGAVVPDVIACDLHVLFCGINPGRWSGAVGHHFAHPGNRFWKALERSGFTGDLLRPEQEASLLSVHLGITNLVARTTARATDLSAAELGAGRVALEGKVRRYRPKVVAILGLGAYRQAFNRPGAAPGRQEEGIAGADVWVLPNPSGLQAQYGLAYLVEELRALRLAVHSPIVDCSGPG